MRGVVKGLLISCGLGAIGYWFARTPSFRGRATWGFEPLGHETRLSNRWHTRPVGALRVLAPAEPDEAIHR